MQQISGTDVWRVTEPAIMDTDRYLSSANAPDIEEDARLCIQSGARDMILNCAPLSYVTGAGLRAFLNIAALMQRVGGNIAIQGLKGQPLEFFQASGLDSVIPTLDEDGL
ncbi:MAG: STAS domain-containing protein [Alphaproteobacteria bacterium]|nr:STAS domain-containing protein [Alphaproteobacteria bacterium]